MKASEKKKSESYSILITLVITCFVLWLLWFPIINYFYPELNNKGLYGDMYGGLNALFTGLAFAGVIYTILLQKTELRLQRKELELTRDELSKSSDLPPKSCTNV